MARCLLLALAGLIQGCGFLVSSDSFSGSEQSGSTADSGSGTAPTACAATLTGTVSKVYPTNGANWNDYIQRASVATPAFQQSDTACPGTGNYYSSCAHGAELLKLEITGKSSCSGLSYQDELGAFEWTCIVNSGQAWLYSLGLKEKKGLKDLITATAFKENRVTVNDGSCIYLQTPSAQWWDSSQIVSFETLGAGFQTLATAGKIYTVSSASFTTDGINFNADKIAFIVLDGARLKHNGGAAVNCNTTTGETGATANCFMAVGTQKYLWIEGSFENGTGTSNTYFANIRYSRIQFFRLSGLTGGTASMLTIQDTGGNSRGNLFRYWTLTNNTTTGGSHLLYVLNTDYSIFDHIMLSNGGGNGLGAINGAAHNVYSHLVSAGNGRYGVMIGTGSTFNTFLHTTLANLGGPQAVSALQLNAPNTTIANVVSTNANIYGFEVTSTADGYRAANLALAHNNSAQFSSLGAVGNTYSGKIRVTATTDCIEGATASTGGIINGTCAPQGASTFALETGANFTNSFVGRGSSDSSNTSDDALGEAVYALALDFYNFEHFFRSWSRKGSTFPAVDHQQACNGASNDCAIWDWRLRASDSAATGLRNFLGETFTPGATCPASVAGSSTLTDYDSNTFLLHAQEIINDSYGDDDGLCESNERCLWAPNFGAYQGEGDYSSRSCTFQNGTVSGVTMYAYPTNGI